MRGAVGVAGPAGVFPPRPASTGAGGAAAAGARAGAGAREAGGRRQGAARGRLPPFPPAPERCQGALPHQTQLLPQRGNAARRPTTSAFALTNGCPGISPASAQARSAQSCSAGEGLVEPGGGFYIRVEELHLLQSMTNVTSGWQSKEERDWELSRLHSGGGIPPLLKTRPARSSGRRRALH